MHLLQKSITAFLCHCEFERNFSAHTIKAYRLDLGQFARFVASTCEPADLTALSRTTLREYNRTLNRYEPRTQRRKLAAIKSFFGFLDREGLIEANPARDLRLNIRLGRMLPRTVSFATLQTFFEHLYRTKNSGVEAHSFPALPVRDVALFELLFSSGMRVSEISNLRVGSVDLARGAVLIRGKGNKERFVPICDDDVLAALAAYAALHQHGEDANSYFFTNRLGRRLSEQSIRTALKRHARAAGIEAVTPHVFRHTVATMLLEQGVDLRFIQTFLGHSSIVTTTIYAHVTEKSQREVLTHRHPRRLLGTSLNRAASIA